MNIVIFIVAFAWIASGIGALTAQSKFIKILRANYPSEWIGLESPRLLGGSISSQYRMLKFLYVGSYRKIGDSSVDRAASSTIRWGSAYICCFLLVVVLVLFTH
jgi:hypothetical protein